jgi:hypothetical protein
MTFTAAGKVKSRPKSDRARQVIENIIRTAIHLRRSRHWPNTRFVARDPIPAFGHEALAMKHWP